MRQMIATDTTLGQLGKQLSSQQALTDQLRSLLPRPLDAQVRAAVVQNRTLSLFVNSPVWASRLRYLAPELIRQLKQQGLVIDQLRTRIVPERVASSASRQIRRAEMSEASAELLRQTAAQLSDNNLREAMLRLSRHGRNNSR